jgi:hypothetical protein
MLLPDLRLRDARSEVKRKNTEQVLWDSAKAVAANFSSRGSWTGQVIEPPPSAAPISVAPSGMTVDGAINIFLSEQSEALAANTLR